VPVTVREDIVMASMDAVIGCMNVLVVRDAYILFYPPLTKKMKAF